jgi:hypothetical protein
MESGNRKTAVVNAMADPPRQWASEQIEKQKPLIAQAKSFRDTDLARIEELRRRAAKIDGDERERALPEVPPTPRKDVKDCTVERLGVMLSENAERMAVIDDEGAAFLENDLEARAEDRRPPALWCRQGMPDLEKRTPQPRERTRTWPHISQLVCFAAWSIIWTILGRRHSNTIIFESPR